MKTQVFGDPFNTSINSGQMVYLFDEDRYGVVFHNDQDLEGVMEPKVYYTSTSPLKLDNTGGVNFTRTFNFETIREITDDEGKRIRAAIDSTEVRK